MYRNSSRQNWIMGLAHMRLKLSAVALASLILAGGATAAETLPGGATSLNEVHGDWTVHCEAASNTVACAVQQTQVNPQNNQRLLAVEIAASTDGVSGTLALPFGLDLAKGVALQIDQQAATEPLPFQTCLPAGCLVRFKLPAEWEMAMRQATALAATTYSVDGQEAKFSISLAGFGSALDRVIALTQ